MKPETLIQLKPEEEILEVVRESFVPRAPQFFLLLLWVLLPFFLLFPLWREGAWGIAVFFLLLLSGLAAFFRALFKWSRTIFILTDKRVVDHNQLGFFYREVSEARYHQIEEVSFKIKGLWPTVFRYGTITMRLQGNAADIEFRRVFQPAHVTDFINDLREAS